MINQTTETAIKVLIFLTLKNVESPVSLKSLAHELNVSHSYLAKIAGLLVKAGILRTHRGVSGGVTPFRDSNEVTLLEIVEACQGKILHDYCQEIEAVDKTCSFHKALNQIHMATTEILSHWTLFDLAANPFHPTDGLEKSACRMIGICQRHNKNQL